MNPQTDNSKNRPLIITGLAVLAVAIVCGGAYWFSLRNQTEELQPQPEVVEEQVIADFYTALAALDVEENQLAARTLKAAIELEPKEPALWANLAVAQMRLRETEAAQESLQKAQALANDSRELRLLEAEVLEQAGEIEAAIEQLRQVHKTWPENLAATFSLVSLLGQIRTEEAEVERLTLLSDILKRAPDNLRARCEHARLAATQERGEILRAALDSLFSEANRWSAPLKQQLLEVDKALRAGDFRKAALSLTFFENLLKPRPEYQQSLAQLGVTSAGAIGTPLRSFLRLKMPPAQAADADSKLTFALQGTSENAARPVLVLAFEPSGERSSTLISLSEMTLRVGKSAALPFPGSTTSTCSSSVCIADLDFDFQQDLILAGDRGCRIFLGQADGSFLPADVKFEGNNQAWASVFAVDVEADGDLDLLLSDHQSPLRWIRNNGDMTFTAMKDLLPIDSVRDLRSVDLDGDADADLAMIDTSGTVSVWRNQRGGNFLKMPSPFEDSQLGIAIGDVDCDGQFDLVAVSRSSEIHAATWKSEDTWSRSRLTTWSASRSLANAKTGDVFLAVEDLDNNGGVDLIASLAYETGIWLRTAQAKWAQLEETPNLLVSSIADLNGDGLLDLVGLSETGGQIATNHSQAGYGWHIIEPRANKTPGDKRINSFGIGGRITLRAGNLVQSAAIRSPRVHFGLGKHPQANVARIVWPNGTVQAEFKLQANQALIAEQRLKGSCPWVFTFDGNQYRFIKDFIWRSPLGLRINAQTTAGVTQTEDWIKIPGEHLAPRNGQYSIRITAELWETHFFDQVALLAVDHPADVEVFVDERFIPNQPPSRTVTVTTKPQPLQNMTNHQGNSLDEPLRSIDGLYADRFALGEYQGVAENHWVEFEFPDEISSDRPVLIVGHGWIYPTDSSLNVALGQREGPRPYGLILEQQNPDGAWEVVRDKLGFPAGKNKNVLIELPSQSLAGSGRFRLRTNMEIYWDFLGWSYALDEIKPRVTQLPLEVAELRHRGYSKLNPVERRRPDTPFYEVEAVEQRWLDLEGYYTRFGDVRELLTGVDDRYVIMNAGDELAFEFNAETEIPAGYRRDFVLIGDGWVKDGDFNTAFSRWIRPLPSHEDKDYAGPLVPLAEDLIYQKHPDDWRIYHTRYISPRQFQQRLWPMTTQHKSGEIAQ